MKKKLLSLFLALSMLLTSVLCLLPVAAEPDYDTLAAAEGYVCRIGDANADYTGYYKKLTDAITAVFGGKNTQTATFTLIVDNLTMGGDLYIQNNNNLVVNGGGHDFTATNCFRVYNGGSLTVNNLKIKTNDNSDARIVLVPAPGSATLTFEDCTFTTTATYTCKDAK